MAPRARAFGIAFDLLDLDAACEVCGARAPGLAFAYVVTPHAVHVVRTYRGDARVLEGINAAWLVTCDSRVVRNLASMLFGTSLAMAPGSDLTQMLLLRVVRPDDPITVIGGDDRLADTLRRQFGLRRLSLYSPPFGFARDPAEIARCIEFVRVHPARFVFLACGAPQSEQLGAALCADGRVTGLGLCIGASLLFATGEIRRAPLLVQKLSLEWLHRLVQEPRRLSRRLWQDQLPLLWVALRYRAQARSGSPHGTLPDAAPRAEAWPQ